MGAYTRLLQLGGIQVPLDGLHLAITAGSMAGTTCALFRRSEPE